MKKIIILLAIMSMFLMGLVYAASLTLVSTTWGQDGFVNVTLGTTACTNYCGNATEYVTLYATCSDTANSSISLVYNITNSSTTDDSTNFNWGYANFTFGDDLILEDSAVCSVTGITTGVGDADAVLLAATTVNIDRTTPSAPTTTQASQSVLKAGNVITYTVTGTDTTKCRIAFLTSKSPRATGSNTFAMVHSGDTCKYIIPSITVGDGVYSMFGWAGDGTNSSFSSPLDIEIDNIASNTQQLDSGTQVAIGESIGEKVKADQIAIVAIVIIGLYAIFGRKGRKG